MERGGGYNNFIFGGGVNFSKHPPSGPMLSISQNFRLSVRLFVRLSVCVFTFEVPFKRLFAPTSQSRMSNILRDLKSLGKSKWKKLSQIKKIGLKSFKNRRAKIMFFFLLILPWIRDLWSKGASLILAYLWTFLSFCDLDDFFRFSKKSGFRVFLVHPETTFPMD